MDLGLNSLLHLYKFCPFSIAYFKLVVTFQSPVREQGYMVVNPASKKISNTEHKFRELTIYNRLK